MSFPGPTVRFLQSETLELARLWRDAVKGVDPDDMVRVRAAREYLQGQATVRTEMHVKALSPHWRRKLRPDGVETVTNAIENVGVGMEAAGVPGVVVAEIVEIIAKRILGGVPVKRAGGGPRRRPGQ